jgi:hypothetical protein
MQILQILRVYTSFWRVFSAFYPILVLFTPFQGIFSQLQGISPHFKAKLPLFTGLHQHFYLVLLACTSIFTLFTTSCWFTPTFSPSFTAFHSKVGMQYAKNK